MPETTDPRTVPVPPAAAPPAGGGRPVPVAARVRVPSAELDQLRSHAAALASFRQAVIDLAAGRPDTDLMTVAELRAAVGAPPTVGAPLPVTWTGDVVAPPTVGGPRALLPLATSHGTPACLPLSRDECTRLSGRLAATLHPAEACTTPRCGQTEHELDLYVDDDAPACLGWIAVRVCGAPGPIRWWCSPACAASAITAAGAHIAAADRTAAAAAAGDGGPLACVRCGCTEDRACPPGCSWVPNPQALPGGGVPEQTSVIVERQLARGMSDTWTGTAAGLADRIVARLAGKPPGGQWLSRDELEEVAARHLADDRPVPYNVSAPPASEATAESGAGAVGTGAEVAR